MTKVEMRDELVWYVLRQYPINGDHPEGLTAEEIRHVIQRRWPSMVFCADIVKRSIARLRKRGRRIETTVTGRQPGRYRIITTEEADK